MQKLKVEYVSTEELRPYQNNAKIHTDEQIDQIARSIEEFGMNDPIAVWNDNEIIEGHGRLMACQKLGITEVPVIRLDGLTDEQRRAYMNVHNQLTMNTGFDIDLLAEELGKIENIDMSLFGFDISDFVTSPDNEPMEDDYTEPEELEHIVQRGERYALGDHVLMCGDSTNDDDITQLVDDASIDFILSDPPYGMKLDTDYSSMKSKLFKGKTGGAEYKEVIGDNDDFSPELIGTFFKNFGYVNEMFLFGADYFSDLIPNRNDGSWLVWDKRLDDSADKMYGSCFELIWSKNRHKRDILRYKWAGIFGMESQDTDKRIHPTQKPTTMLAGILNEWGGSANTVLDLYGGSGSTLIACEQLGKTCYMMEYDPHYCDVIIDRWETFTGQKAVKL